jgi:hypothetical protein
MHPGVPQVMLGLLCIVGGVLVVKLLGNEYGWLVFLLGGALAIRGGIALSQSGQKELNN